MEIELGRRRAAPAFGTIILPEERLPTVDRQVLSLPTLLTVIVTIVAVGLVPTFVAGRDLDSYAIPYQVGIFTTLVRTNPVYLVFPVVACLPYVLGFLGLTQNRFLVYARLRASARSILGGHMLACGVVTGISFAVIGALPGIWMAFGGYQLQPETYGFFTPESIRAAEASEATFTQLVPWGAYAVPVAYGCWVGMNAALYALISLCLSLLQRSRVVALIAPWAVEMVLEFGMAVLGLEGFSPGLIMPFNLTQLPLTNLVVPLVGLSAVVVAFMLAVLVRPDRLHRLQ